MFSSWPTTLALKEYLHSWNHYHSPSEALRLSIIKTPTPLKSPSPSGHQIFLLVIFITVNFKMQGALRINGVMSLRVVLITSHDNAFKNSKKKLLQ